ncbi:MAG: aminotransferase class III-fold pyridoxal phosphate-dependent enzyme [Pseudomonadota bacterium]
MSTLHVPLDQPPRLTATQAAALAAEHFDLAGVPAPLPSHQDQNFALTNGAGEGWVLKIANPAGDRSLIELQTGALDHLQQVAPDLPVPALRLTRGGHHAADIQLPDGRRTQAWVVSRLPGETLEKSPGAVSPAMAGQNFAALSIALRGYFHPSGRRTLIWDLAQAQRLRPLLDHLEGSLRRAVTDILNAHGKLKRGGLRAQFIHNDLNPANVLQAGGEISGIIDFGDMIHGPTIDDLAIAAAYALYDAGDEVATFRQLVQGWHRIDPLGRAEICMLPLLVATRAATTVTVSHAEAARQPDNRDYLLLHTARATKMVERFAKAASREHLADTALRGCGLAGRSADVGDSLIEQRRRVLGSGLRLFYDKPLTLESGEGCYLTDQSGRRYLDCYNNVAHVGHAHPAVATAVGRQMKRLNTNTRYLVPEVVAYAARLAALLPDPLSVVRFTCTGSEATDLAVRIAQAATGRQGMLVSQHAYHGNTGLGLSVSPEEVGLAALPDWVGTLAVSDQCRGEPPAAGDLVATACGQLARRHQQPAAILFDSLLTSDGIFALGAPVAGRWIDEVRHQGALWIADEVQVGFGRTGSHSWGFERFDRIPDLVTLGKPMGNGFPLAAIVMTPAMAAAADSVYYFNTFAGNPVAAAAGSAVLDVLEDEGLPARAREVGLELGQALESLAADQAVISEVRGCGLHQGIDVVDAETGRPDAARAEQVVNRMKSAGVLVGRTGQHSNVVKIRPPMVFGAEHIPVLTQALLNAFED